MPRQVANRRSFAHPPAAQKLDRKEPITILVTGAAGQIAYNLVFLIARGDMLGRDQPVNLVLLDVPVCAAKLDAVVMELEDCASAVVHREPRR